MIWQPNPTCTTNPPVIDARRRRVTQWIAAVPLLTGLPGMPAETAAQRKRAIPHSGELLPVIGLGTYVVFDVTPNAPEMADLRQALKTFVAGGGSVVDSSPMYGRAEARVGELAAGLGLHPSLFLATKVWTSGRQSGIDQMQASLRLLRAQRIDLMQVHNLLDLATHLQTLRAWKRDGKIRYLGVTHYHTGAYPELERLLKTRDFDFAQFNYSLAEREAEARLLSVAAETGTAVIINRPFAHGELFGRVKGKALPAWAAEFDCDSWAQFFLKYIVAHPAVTCVIPGTGKARHMTDNLKAGSGRLPDERLRKRMVELILGF
ncbi:MAG: aldo/keto reductase [Betaproteobacteria bacterium]|nr:aldo/keto reductase [Betaproteobacteria bacterium]